MNNKMICIECGNEYERKYKNTKSEGFCCYLCAQRNWYKRNKKHIKEYRDINKDKRNKNRRDKYNNNEEFRNQIKEKVKKWQSNNPDKRKEQRIRKYEINLNDYNKLLEKQNYKCAICGYDNFDDKNFFPIVDHDHLTNKVRGLLCLNCNFGIGSLKDNTDLLKNAIKYLEENNG
jgi:DNA-directed RNA polymerase subunit RPC12/RpoP